MGRRNGCGGIESRTIWARGFWTNEDRAFVRLCESRTPEAEAAVHSALAGSRGGAATAAHSPIDARRRRADAKEMQGDCLLPACDKVAGPSPGIASRAGGRIDAHCLFESKARNRFLVRACGRSIRLLPDTRVFRTSPPRYERSRASRLCRAALPESRGPTAWESLTGVAVDAAGDLHVVGQWRSEESPLRRAL